MSSSSSTIIEPAALNPRCVLVLDSKTASALLAGDYASALDALSRAKQLLWTSPSIFEDGGVSLLRCLSAQLSIRFRNPDGQEDLSSEASAKEEHLKALAEHHKQLELWAENCPENFENRAALVGAEIARIQGRTLEADGSLRTGHPLGACKWFRPQ